MCRKDFKKSIKTAVIYFSLLVFASISVGLAYQKKKLSEEISLMEMEADLPQVGRWIPELKVTDINGFHHVIARTGNRRQVLFLFTTKCKYCITSMPYVFEIKRSFDRLGIDFIGITPETNVDEVRAFAITHKASFPIVSMPDKRNLNLLGFRVSPSIMVISPEGQLEKVKLGQIDSNKDAFEFVASFIPKDAGKLANTSQGGLK